MPMKINDIKDENVDVNESSTADPIDYTELIQSTAFAGKYPYNTIIESITTQFQDYINNEDTNDYVDIFFNQLAESRHINDVDNDLEHPSEVNEVLNNIYSNFVSTMRDLFESRLNIVIMVEDDENTEEDELEIIIRRLYEFFILNARQNFKYVISHDIDAKLASFNLPEDDDNLFYHTIDDMLTQYSPICIGISPTEFIRLTENEEILNMYETMQFTGNFLRKYSPKLYINDNLNAEIISEIAIMQDIRREELNNGSKNNN